MLWVRHAFSETLEDRVDILGSEPQGLKLEMPIRVHQYVWEFRGLPRNIALQCKPAHDIEGTWAGNRYLVRGLHSFAGDIILLTEYIEWRIACFRGEVRSVPRLNLTPAARGRLDRLRGLWFERIPGATDRMRWFDIHPTGCTRVLVLTELQASINSPIEAAAALDEGTFMFALEHAWPVMAAYIRALGCDPSSGVIDGRRRDVEFGLLHFSPPVLSF